jgi:hypothetical protein
MQQQTLTEKVQWHEISLNKFLGTTSRRGRIIFYDAMIARHPSWRREGITTGSLEEQARSPQYTDNFTCMPHQKQLPTITVYLRGSPEIVSAEIDVEVSIESPEEGMKTLAELMSYRLRIEHKGYKGEFGAMNNNAYYEYIVQLRDKSNMDRILTDFTL